jgi:uncharacterized heparinase superfamily protein
VENLFDIDEHTSDSNSIGESGYYMIESGELKGIVDGGVHCPEHLPAHAHNDLGNIVLWAGEEPVITDTGAYDYQPGERREYARSVKSHNTVQIGDCDQTVTHGRFMMGPRPQPETEYLDTESKQGISLRYHSPRFVRPYSHERSVKPISDGIRIDDRVSATESTVTSRFHLSPKTKPRLDGGTVEIILPDETVVKLIVNGADSIDIIETERYPEYGVNIEQPTIEAKLPTVNETAHITHEITYRKKNKNE